MTFIKTLGGLGLLAFLLLGSGCRTVADSPEANHATNFGSPTTLSVGQKVLSDDGLVVTLVEINDSRCAPGVVCIWAGELSPTLMLTGGKVHGEVEVILGTTTKPSATVGKYTVNLNDATENTATITIQN